MARTPLRDGIQLLKSVLVIVRMGARGREWVEEKWGWDMLSQRLRELLS